MITIATIGSLVKKNLAGYLIQKGIKKILENDQEFENKLESVIDKTILEYSRQYPELDLNGKHSFYKSQIIIDELLKYRIMSGDLDEDRIIEIIRLDKKVYPTDKKKVDKFIELFIKNIELDNDLRKLEINATYKEEIFKIGPQLKNLENEVGKIINEHNPELYGEWHRQLEVYNDSIENFRPQTALHLIEELETALQKSNVSKNDKLLAYLFFRKAQCYELMNNGQEMFKNYINAYNRNPDDDLFKSKAALSYFKLNEIPQALIICDDLLKFDKFNIFVWFIKLATTKIEELDNTMAIIPSVVREDIDFKRLIFFYFFGNKPTEQIFNLFLTNSLFPIIDYDLELDEMTYKNHKKYIFYFHFTFSQIFNSPFVDFTSLQDKENPAIKFINKLSKKILSRIEDSEIKDNYSIVNFVYYYSSFVLNKSKESVTEMIKFLPHLNSENSFFEIVVANCLQLINEIPKAIEIMDASKFNDCEIYFLKAFCYLKLNNVEKFIKTHYEYTDRIEEINKIHLSRILPFLYKLSYPEIRTYIDVQRLVNNKKFSNPKYKEFIETFCSAINPKDRDAIINLLNELEKDIVNIGEEFIFFIAFSYLLLDDFTSSIKCFRTYLDKDKEGEDLFYYILALHNSKLDHAELLSLLKKWRIEFSYHEDLLRVEADLRRELSDWEELSNISEKLLSKHPDDEVFLTHYLFSLNELSKKDIILTFKDQLKSFSFKDSNNAIIVFNILFECEIYDIGLEILYNQAKNIDNKAARMEYLQAVIKYPPSYFVEPEIVEIGCYVKYLLNGKVESIEISDSTIKSNPLAKSLLNHFKNEFISVNRPLSDVFDQIHIVRIMNKYLFLHDEILEEAKNTYSGLKMETFEFEGTDFESMNRTFIKYFGARGSLIHDTREKNLSDYYSYNLSFSELINANYDLDFLNGFYNLISYQKGLMVCPLFLQAPISFPENIEFVIDYSSLFSIYELSKSFGLKHTKKFIIANGIVETINRRLRSTKTQPKHELSIDITLNGVIPYKIPDDYKENHVKFLEELLDWIKENCITKIPESRLDYIRQKTGTKNINPEFENYMIDNLYLSINNINTILISDDSLYYRFFNGTPGKVISSEFYLKKMFVNWEELLLALVQRKYIGITLSKEILLGEFNKKIQNKPNCYNQCLINISLALNPIKENVEISIRFLKEIFLSSLLQDKELRREATNIFINLLQGNSKPELLVLSLKMINSEFKLMGKKLDLMLQAYGDALYVLNQKK